jgi:hypothetical protein
LASRKGEATPDSFPTRLLLRSVAELYHADALLHNENCDGDLVEDEVPWECTQRAIDALDYLAGKAAPLAELQIATLNDHGIALLVKGDSMGALRCFREAVKRATYSRRSGESANDCPTWLFLPTHFNLSLLLLRDGRIDESAKTWLGARGHIETWQKAMRGNNEALRRLKDICVVSINRHGLLIAKRGMTGALWDQENVVEWVPPVVEGDVVTEGSTRIDGVDASQISAMDVLLLKYASSTAEKKSSLSFRRSAGNVVY